MDFGARDDLTLDKIDYTWVENCNKAKELKKALFLLEQDGI